MLNHSYKVGEHAKISWRELSWVALKLKFVKIFSLKSFPLYGSTHV